MRTPSPSDNHSAGVLRMLALAVVVAVTASSLASCRSTLMGPSGTVPPAASLSNEFTVTTAAPGATDGPLDTVHAMVPAISHLLINVTGTTLYVRGTLHQRSRFYRPFYGPEKLGGWSMQVFVDNDASHSAYWRGYDYVVRGVEWSPSRNSFTIRQITLDPETPGGWGPAVGDASFTQSGQTFEVAIPLEAVGGVDRGVNLCVETYATLECAGCSGGLTHEWADDYFGSAGDVREHQIAGRSATGSLMARLAPRSGHSAAMDTRFVQR